MPGTGSVTSPARRTTGLPPPLARWVNAAVGRLAELGLLPGTVVLEVTGRRSGRPRRTPVVVAEHVGRRHLVSLGGEADWVRNVRAAGGRAILRHRGAREVRLVEVPIAERGPVLHAFLSRRALSRSPARAARRYFGLPPHPPVEQLAPLAAHHPVFVVDALPGEAGSALAVARDARRALREGPAGIAARQQRRLAALVDHARRHSPFYAEHYRDVPAGPVDLRALPPVTKPELMARFDDWVTDPEVTRAAVEAFVADPGTLGTDLLGRYVVYTTSGSTGVPALVVQDRRAVAVLTGLAYGRSRGVLPVRVLVRVLLHGARQAAVFATGGHFLTTVMFERRLRARPFRRRIARFFSVLEPLPRLVAELDAFRPALLSSYANTLALLADEQLAGRLHISPVVVTSGGEPLLPDARRRIDAAFGCPVTESYNASEVPLLSLSCSRGRLHVNTDWFVVEPVDATGAPVPEGRLSHSVLVTNLANLVQPVIRYDLGDSVALDGRPCPCGSPLPTIRVEGRTDEILRLARPAAEPVALTPMALSTVVEETPGVRRFQVVQTAPSALQVRLETHPDVPRDEVWRAVRTRLHDFLAVQGLPGVSVDPATEAPVAGPHGGKLRHVLAAPGGAAPS